MRKVEKITCDICEGTGVFVWQLGPEDIEEYTCSACGGTGIIQEPEADEEALEALARELADEFGPPPF